MRQSLQVVSVETNARHAKRLEQCLCAVRAFDIGFLHVRRPAVALEPDGLLRADVLFIDYDLPEVTGLEVIAAARAAGELRPLIATASQDCGYLAAELIRAGADGYLAKPDCNPQFVGQLLASSIGRSQGRVKQTNIRRQAVREMLRQHGQTLALV